LKLSIVIVNYNVRYFLEQTLVSIYKSTVDFAYEVFVVDNQSTDGSVQLLEQKFTEVHIIANSKNVGFSKANNQAIRQAKGEYILLLNPDTIIQENTLQLCVDKLDSDTQIGGLGVKMVDGSGHFLPESKRGFPTPFAAFSKLSGLSKLFPNSRVFGKYHLGYLDKEQTHEVDVLSGACMFLRKSVLDIIGLLDEAFFMYGEDIDISYRINNAGFKNIYFANTSIIHFKGESTKKGSLNYIKTFYQAMLIFCNKHVAGTDGLIMKILLHIAIYVRGLMAFLQQLLQPFGLPLLDISIMTGNLYFLHIFWERVVKSNDHIVFPITYFYFNIPIYVLIWLSSMYFVGVYKNGNKWKSIWMAQLAGTIVIAVCYAFFPNSLRTSRGIIVSGLILNLAVFFIYRCIYHWQNNSLNIFLKNEKKYLIVADEDDALLMAKKMEPLDTHSYFIGFISIHNDSKHIKHLGSIENIHAVIEMYQPNEILFTTEHLSSQFIIDTMSHIEQVIAFKMVSKNETIISSTSKNKSGEIFKMDIERKSNIHWLDAFRNWWNRIL